MVSEKEFQEKMRRLGALVGELDQLPAGGSKVAARELVQLLMEVHGAGLEQILELVKESGTGDAIIHRFGDDPIARNLLLLYGLHPDNFEARVIKALDALKGRLRKLNCEVKLISIQEGEVQVRLYGPARKDLRSIVEGGLYDLAPDLISLTVLGVEDESSSGFVPLESLRKHSFAAPSVERG
jgi:hypothetical protein